MIIVQGNGSAPDLRSKRTIILAGCIRHLMFGKQCRSGTETRRKKEMCKYRFLEDANVNGYLLDDLDEEEMTYQEVIQATTNDFAYTVKKLRRSPDNKQLIDHAAELMRFIWSEECFQFMDIDRDTYIKLMLAGVGLNVMDILGKVYQADFRHAGVKWPEKGRLMA